MKVKRPNAVLFFLIYILVYPLLKIFFRLKVEKKDMILPKGSFIVLSNHKTMLDFLLVMLELYPKRRLNAVAASKWFLYKPLNRFLPLMGAIPKSMFDSDVGAIVGIKTVLKRGDGVLLFPEGRCSTSGAYSGIHKSTGKLIKKLGVPVISCYIEGVYNCMPHWRDLFRSGRIRLTCKNLFDVGDLKNMSVDEINLAIDNRLRGVEGALPITKPFQTFRARRLADGLHKILYWCPICKTEYETSSLKNEILCKSCFAVATLDRFGDLSFDSETHNIDNRDIAPRNIMEWFNLQAMYEAEKITENMEPIVERVTVRIPSGISGGGMIDSGDGVMRVCPKGWSFEGILSGEQVNLFFPVETVPAISYEHYDNIQIYHGGKYYMFVPEEPKRCLKYAIIAETLHWKFSEKTLLTKGDVQYYTLREK